MRLTCLLQTCSIRTTTYTELRNALGQLRLVCHHYQCLIGLLVAVHRVCLHSIASFVFLLMTDIFHTLGIGVLCSQNSARSCPPLIQCTTFDRVNHSRSFELHPPPPPHTPHFVLMAMLCLGFRHALTRIVYLVSIRVMLATLCLSHSPAPLPLPAARLESLPSRKPESLHEQSPPADDANNDQVRAAPPPPPIPNTPVTPAPTAASLDFTSLNVGGPEITPNRLCHLLSGFPTSPHVLCLQEFKPTASHHITHYQRVALHWKYHLLHSSPSTKNGVAILVHISISPKLPPLRVHLPGILISTLLHLHPDPTTPPVRIASFYGPHTVKDKRPCEAVIDTLLRESCIILGDYNSTTHASQATTLKPNLWPRLIAKEKSGAMEDLLLPHQSGVPYTRVRRYAITKSYIDRAYGTRLFKNSFSPTAATVRDFSGVHGASDHDPIVISTIPWAAPHLPVPRCSTWNRRDLHRYRTAVERSTSGMATPAIYHDVALSYSALSSKILDAMREVNAAKPPFSHSPADVSDWQHRVRQLSRQAKRRSGKISIDELNTPSCPPQPPRPCRYPHARSSAFCNGTPHGAGKQQNTSPPHHD